MRCSFRSLAIIGILMIVAFLFLIPAKKSKKTITDFENEHRLLIEDESSASRSWMEAMREAEDYLRERAKTLNVDSQEVFWLYATIPENWSFSEWKASRLEMNPWLVQRNVKESEMRKFNDLLRIAYDTAMSYELAMRRTKEFDMEKLKK